MAEVRLPDLRIGFAYGADMIFPAGFLAVGESIRAKLRQYPGQTIPDAVFASNRVGDTVELTLNAAQTAALKPGTYLTEAVLYVPAAPATPEIPITDNTFRIEANYSPSA